MSEEGIESPESGSILVGLSEAEQARVRVVQRILSAPDAKSYMKYQREGAKALGISLRSIRRLLQRWREGGVSGVVRQPHQDQGERQTSEEWQRYIVSTWREGNREGRRMSPAQVYLRVRSRASELSSESHPSRSTVYRILRPEIAKKKRREQIGSVGWRGSRLQIKTQSGLTIEVEHSNQVWQADHTKADVLVVEQSGEVLGRPWLTTVVDSYSRCIMSLHLGMAAPSAAVVCLALRNAILPKQYGSGYELKHSWPTYGLPTYLYTDNGKEFHSLHLEQVANDLGIVLCHRRRPSDGGIVERPFGTFNSEVFSALPGYTGSHAQERPQEAEAKASLTLAALDRILVRYVVDRYNRSLDARTKDQSRLQRWEAGCIAQLPLLGERELDICLMRRESRTVYRGGYLQFHNLTYLGEHLAGYAGEKVVIRYNPRDITTIWVYQYAKGQDTFLTRAHTQDLETEVLSIAEAKAISRRLRRNGRLITNQALLEEVCWRDAHVDRNTRPAVPSPQPMVSAPPQSDPPAQPAARLKDAKAEPKPASEFDDDGVIADEDVPDVEVYYPDDVFHRWGGRGW